MTLDRAVPERWVSDMARTMVQEITQVMTGVVFQPGVPPPPESVPRMEAIIGHVEGACSIELRFLAEPALLRCLVENMSAAPAGDQEVQEYAMEYFNVLCGRFISEIYKATGISARFFPTRYEVYPDLSSLSDQFSMRTVYFTSEQGHLAAFSWTSGPINDLLRRSAYA